MKKIKILGILFFVVFLSPGLLRGPSASAKSASVFPKVKTYEELRRAISQARGDARVRVEKAVEQERVREAWEIGSLIDAHVLQHKERADYAKQVLFRLAGDLGMSDSELYRMLEFYRAYPIFAHARKLSWSEYRELLAVNDPKDREALAERTEKEGWTRDRLRKEIKALRSGTGSASESGPVPLESLSSAPGKPGTYRVIQAKVGPYAGELAIDLGFSNYIRIAEAVEDASSFKAGDMIQVARQGGQAPFSENEKGARPRPSLQKGGTVADLFTYEAYVYRVLDGDTIEAVVDLGFGITTTQTLRFRGIDAPEIATSDGEEAKSALEKMLKAAKGPVLISAVKSDKYDRYLADVFVNKAYINQKLVDDGLAVIVEG